MIEELKRIVKDTTEEEAKSLLLRTLYGIQMTDEIAEYSDLDFSADLKKPIRIFCSIKEIKPLLNTLTITHIISFLATRRQGG
ncbi:hypothetical protein [Bacillus sp. P14.5]|uniref:hypothetical protein n=1 Tax=Bacillus sp. P14.5 TaxID=1983400 RepID=UPI000DE9291C|nr:hypothetical protein [Bacillus sp. P14.5]